MDKDTSYKIKTGYTVMTALGWFKGVLEKETKLTLTLSRASWVPETAQFSEYVQDDSKVKEEEPLGGANLIVERSSIIASFEMKSITQKLV